MRQSRRGCFYQNKEHKYIWNVYTYSQIFDTESYTTGSQVVYPSSGKKYWYATDYTYNCSEKTFTLTSPTNGNLFSDFNTPKGKYLISLSGFSNKSGSTLYLITGTSSTLNGVGMNIYYKRWDSSSFQEVKDFINTVGSDTLDYPTDGEKDGYWYVLVKGEYEMHVWDEYNVNCYIDESDTSTTASGQGKSSQKVMAASSYIVNSDGTVSLVDATQTSYNKLAVGKYLVHLSSSDSTETSGNYLYKIESTSSLIQSGTVYKIVNCYKWKPIVEKDAASDNSVESTDIAAYPDNGVQDGMWYIYSHSYIYKFDNR
ncbi:MAG: hypothetical protein PUF04_09340 [bacterium]|nr:hypothetical protein [bacterium]